MLLSNRVLFAYLFSVKDASSKSGDDKFKPFSGLRVLNIQDFTVNRDPSQINTCLKKITVVHLWLEMLLLSYILKLLRVLRSLFCQILVQCYTSSWFTFRARVLNVITSIDLLPPCFCDNLNQFFQLYTQCIFIIRHGYGRNKLFVVKTNTNFGLTCVRKSCMKKSFQKQRKFL